MVADRLFEISMSNFGVTRYFTVNFFQKLLDYFFFFSFDATLQAFLLIHKK